MSLPKLFTRIFWHNNTTPAIDEDNLNAMSKAIDDIDDRVIGIAGTIMEDVPQIQEDMEILGPAVESIDDNVAAAQASAEAAEEQALKSEGFAVGEQDGVPVGSDSEYFENNAEYFANIANPPIRVIKDFAPIISITDAINKKARDVRIKVEPVQDLHGYTKPWVGGAGKNMTSYATSINIPANSQSSPVLFTLTLTEGKTYTFSCKQSATITTSTRNTLKVTTPSSVDRFESTSSNFNPTNLRHKLTFTASESGTYTFGYWYHTASNTATLTEWQVEESSSFTSYEPYENICPITGHSQAKVTRIDKNLVDLATWEQGAIQYDAGKAYSQVKVANNTRIRTAEIIALDVSKSYTLSVKTGFEFTFQVFDSQQKMYSITSSNTWGASAVTISNVPYVAIALRKSSQANLSPSKEGDSQFALANQCEIYTIDLNGIRYGGVLDVDAGTLTLTHKSIDMGDIEWWRSTSYANPFFYGNISDSKTDGGLIASCYEKITNYTANQFGAWALNGQCCHASNTVQVFARNDAYTDTEAFTTAMTGQTFVYELATPQTIALTPAQIDLLFGYNTLFADTGDVYLEYDASGILRIAEAKLDIDVFKAVTAASSDFADFKSRVAAL